MKKLVVILALISCWTFLIGFETICKNYTNSHELTIPQLYVSVTGDVPSDSIGVLKLYFTSLNWDNPNFHFYSDSLTTFSINEVEEGFYQLHCIAWDQNGNQFKAGVYGDSIIPTAVEVNDELIGQTLGINLNQDYWENTNVVGHPVTSGSIVTYPYVNICQGKPYPSYSHYYVENDFLCIEKKVSWDNSSNSFLEIEYNSGANQLLKINNLSINDTWESIRVVGDSTTPTYWHAEVVFSETQQFNGEEFQVYVVETIDPINTRTCYIYMAENIGILMTLIYNNYSLYAGSILGDYQVEGDDTFFPISTQNYWSRLPICSQETPWNLRLDNQSVLRWEGPVYNNIDYDGYRIYAGGDVIDEIDFQYRSYSLPLDENRTQYSVSVSAYNDEVESGHSNSIEVSMTANENSSINIPKSSLHNCYPNPFNPVTNISFNIAESSTHTSIIVYNVKGQKVKELCDSVLKRGEHKIQWNGLDDDKREVSSGVYILRMQTGVDSDTQKLILLK